MPTTNIEDLLSEDPAEQMLPSQDTLTKMASMGQELSHLTSAMAQAEEAVAELGRKLNDLKCKRIPDFLTEVGLEEFKLLDGRKVSMAPKYYANISEARREAAHRWLRENGYDGIIKNRFQIEFSKGEDEDAESFRLLLDAKGVPFDNKESVHVNTLTAFVKEQIEAGTELPRELFGVHVQMEADITDPKERKRKKK